MESFLNKSYGVKDVVEVRDHYNSWSASYDAEISKNGYATPARCAAALADAMADKTQPILDFGCGTGLSGLALRMAGFDTIDGLDLSPEMLALARAKDVYRSLDLVNEQTELSHSPGDYAAICAIGVIGAGAAPIEVFDVLMHALGTGGLFVFSFNDHALEDPAYEARIMEWTDCGAAHLLFREHGDHLPGIDLNSTVYVLEKA